MFTAQQLAVGHFTAGQDIQIYINNLDWTSIGVNSSPPLVVSLNQNNVLTDITSKVFPNGVPKIYWSPRVGTADFNEDGYTDIYVADGGADTPPWPGGQASVLLSDSGKTLTNTLYGIPSIKTTNHGFGIGDVNGSGHLSVLNTALMNLTESPTELLVNNGHTFINSPNLLPSFLNQTWTPNDHGTSYTWAGIIDLTGSGRGDLVLGQWDNSSTPSFVLLNNGSGDFSKSVPIPLPSTGINKASVVQITPIDIFGHGVNDLVLSVTPGGSIGNGGPGYMFPYLQFLKNDGNGNFLDITSTAFPQTKQATTSGPNWDIFVTTVDINCDGRQDLLVQGSNDPSYMLINNGDGTFSKTGNFGPSDVVTADIGHNGIYQVISTDQTNGNGMTTGLKIYNTDMPLGNYRYFSGSAAEPNVVGTQYNDIFTAGFGKESFDGSQGVDTIKFTNALRDYTLKLSGGSIEAHHHNSNIDVTGSHVERLQFSDTNVALDFQAGGHAGQAYRLYLGVLGRQGEPGGLGYVMNRLDQGETLKNVASGYLNSPEFQVKYGNADQATFINLLYKNILGRAADSSGTTFINNWIAGGATREDVTLGFTESPEHIAQCATLIGNSGIHYTPVIG